MGKKTFRKQVITPKHLSIAVCLLILFGLFYLNDVPWPWFIYFLVVAIACVAFQPYRIDNKYLTQGNFIAIPVGSIEKVFVKASGSVIVYYSKPYKDKEYTNTIHPVDTEGFVAALQEVNEEMIILREKL